MQIEVDEYGHSEHPCWDEDARLEIIAADIGTPGIVLRINLDAMPVLRRRKRPDGEVVWEATTHFESFMKLAADFLRRQLLVPPSEGVVRFFHDCHEEPRQIR